MPRSAPTFAPPSGPSVDLLVIAGEHSGDQHAAKMVASLRERRPELRVAALGGPELERAGAQLLFDLTHSSVVGIVEVLKNLPFFRALFRETLRWIETHRPKVVCFVDYPGFNLRLAQALAERGLSKKRGGPITTAYYISPQIWAWKEGRRFGMAKHLDSMAVIFPFEVGCYSDTDLAVEFVGHPFLADGYRSPVQYDPDGPILLLPGSRRQAVSRIFPVMLRGYRAFGERAAAVLFPSPEIEAVLKKAQPGPGIELRRTPREGGIGEEPVRASAVLTSSGTMSMHCALAGIPGAIVYRANPLTYEFGRRVVKVPYLGIANLLLNEPMYPEYIQGAATPAALKAELASCLHDPRRREITFEKSSRLRKILRQPATGTVADWIDRHLR